MNLKTIQQEYQNTILMADSSDQGYPKVLEAAYQKYKQDAFTYKQGGIECSAKPQSNG